MAASVKEEEKAPENLQKKREVDKVEVAPGVIVGSLRCFRVPVAIAAESSVGCLLRSVASFLLSRGGAGGEIWAFAALVMLPLSCASLLARIR